MDLSAEQKKTLREETARGFARSAALQHERAALLRKLDVRMVSDDGHSTDRVNQVHLYIALLARAMLTRRCSMAHPCSPRQVSRQSIRVSASWVSCHCASAYHPSPFGKGLSFDAQGTEAARQLQRNMEAEAALISDMSQMYGAIITPHQSICGDLAAWPQVVYVGRLVRYLGERLPDRQQSTGTVRFVHPQVAGCAGCE